MKTEYAYISSRNVYLNVFTCFVFYQYKTQNLYFLHYTSIQMLQKTYIWEKFWLFWKTVAKFHILLCFATA